MPKTGLDDFLLTHDVAALHALIIDPDDRPRLHAREIASISWPATPGTSCSTLVGSSFVSPARSSSSRSTRQGTSRSGRSTKTASPTRSRSGSTSTLPSRYAVRGRR